MRKARGRALVAALKYSSIALAGLVLAAGSLSYFRLDKAVWTHASGSKQAPSWIRVDVASEAGGISLFLEHGISDADSVAEYYRWHSRGLEYADCPTFEGATYCVHPYGFHPLGLDLSVVHCPKGDVTAYAFCAPYWLAILTLASVWWFARRSLRRLPLQYGFAVVAKEPERRDDAGQHG